MLAKAKGAVANSKSESDTVLIMMMFISSSFPEEQEARRRAGREHQSLKKH
jgi:hypothetical protein